MVLKWAFYVALNHLNGVANLWRFQIVILGKAKAMGAMFPRVTWKQRKLKVLRSQQLKKKKINKMCYKDENWKSAEISHVSMATRKWDAWIMPGSLNSFICIRMQLAYRTIEWPIKRVASFWPKNNFHTSHTHTHTEIWGELSSPSPESRHSLCNCNFSRI